MFVKLSEFYAAYGSYHNNIINKAIHMICIPLILCSLLGMLNFNNV